MRIGAFALVVTLLLPLGTSTSAAPVEIVLDGPARVEVGTSATYQGRVASHAAIARIGLAQQPVEILLDGVLVHRMTTDHDGRFAFTLDLGAGRHTITTTVRPGEPLAASAAIQTRAYTLPLAPAEASAEFADGYDIIGVSWHKAPPGAAPEIAGYRVYRAACPCPAEEMLVWDLAPSADMYSGADSGLRAATTYQYRIVAYSDEGEGAAAFASARTSDDMIDQVDALFLGFDVCDGARCVSVGENGEARLAGSQSASVQTRWTGAVLSAGRGMENEAVRLTQGVWAEGVRDTLEANATTGENGSYTATFAHDVLLPTDACRQISYTLSARAHQVLTFAHARLNVCG